MKSQEKRQKRALRTSIAALLVAGLGFATTGCGGGSGEPATGADGKPVTGVGGSTINKAAANKFNQAFDQLKQHDAANDWTDATCNSTAEQFLAAANEQGSGETFFEAYYNAGIAYQRCKNDAKAREIFSDLLGKKPDFHRARVQVALYDYAANKDIDKAIAEMEQAIADAEFKNEEALVNLAMFQMTRDSSTGGSNCDSDFDCAKLNLQRALAINDAFMPAFNQLAVYYLESAKKKAGRKKTDANIAAANEERKKADTQALELAALVCSQALRKNPKYAPVYNTSGLISAELDDLSAAARAFGTARQLDPKFFEAHMNYAAVNLQFRGFAQAEDAYRQALKLRPNDYEAHLGLALALRGGINDSNWDKNVQETEQLLEKAKGIDGNRPETYYNEAILVQEFKAREGGSKAEPTLLKAKELFSTFVQKAGSDEQYADAVKRAEERMGEIDQIIEFNRQSAEDQARMEAMLKAEEAKKQLEGQQ